MASSSLSRNRTQAPSIGNMETWPLDHREVSGRHFKQQLNSTHVVLIMQRTCLEGRKEFSWKSSLCRQITTLLNCHMADECCNTVVSKEIPIIPVINCRGKVIKLSKSDQSPLYSELTKALHCTYENSRHILPSAVWVPCPQPKPLCLCSRGSLLLEWSGECLESSHGSIEL